MTPDTKNWGADPWRAPDLAEGDMLLFSEHGRVLENVCYRSHYFRLVRGEYGTIALLVKHGGGQERLEDFSLRKIVKALDVLDSDNRYLTMYAIYQAHRNGLRKGQEDSATKYEQAFVNGRLRKRKYPNQARVKVWIERPVSIALHHATGKE